MSTRILALTDALGHLVRIVLLLGHRHDSIGVPPLIEDVAFGGLIADKAFDSDALTAELNERGAKVVISQHPVRAQPLKIDPRLCERRHLIEDFFRNPKTSSRIALRTDKTDQSFTAMIYLATVINSR